MPLKTYPWDGSRYLDDEESQRDLLADAIETGGEGYIAHAIGMIARSRGIDQIAAQAGISREMLYDFLGEWETADRSVPQRVFESLGHLTSTKDAA